MSKLIELLLLLTFNRSPGELQKIFCFNMHQYCSFNDSINLLCHYTWYNNAPQSVFTIPLTITKIKKTLRILKQNILSDSLLPVIITEIEIKIVKTVNFSIGISHKIFLLKNLLFIVYNINICDDLWTPSSKNTHYNYLTTINDILHKCWYKMSTSIILKYYFRSLLFRSFFMFRYSNRISSVRL